MADNIGITAGTGTIIASDDIAGIQHQRIKMVIGADGVSNGDIAATNPMPSKLYDPAGVAIDSLNSGAGLNAMNVAFTGTNYISSVNNSSVAQLASNATFTGALDNTFNQQAVSILVTSDQPGTLTIKQYSDAAGTRAVPDIVINHATGGISRSITLNGNYFRITYKNTGFATTTSLKIDVAFGTIPATTALGNSQMSLDEIAGTSITPRPDGFLRVAIDPVGLLYDTFETLDTTNTWTVGGTTLPAGINGNLSVAPGTAANASSYARSIPTFLPSSSGYLQMADLIQIEATAVTGNVRFWGLGFFTTPTATVPITNGSIFEILSSDGSLWATTWSNSVRTNAVQIARPADGNFHRYAIYYKASRVYFEIDNVQVASISFPNPQVATLSTVIGSVNGAAAVATAPVLNATLIGLSDTGRNSTKLSDGTFPWRTQRITSDGAQVNTSVDGYKATYSTSISNLVPVATAATDIFTLTGSATKTVRVTRVTITGTQTTAAQVSILLVKRSTANTAGTSTANVAIPHDSTSAAATATSLSYTANPTVGAAIGSALRSRKVFVGTTTGNSDEYITDFGTRNSQSVVLRGTGQVFAVNLNGASIAGPSFNISIEWTEE